MKKKLVMVLLCVCSLGMGVSCGSSASWQTKTSAENTTDIVETKGESEDETGCSETSNIKSTTNNQIGEMKKMNYSALFHNMELTECQKGIKYNNPLITQEFGADPYAMVYDDTLYIYMTQDEYEKNGEGEIVDNSYSKIKTIRVISTKDGVNWTDHGAVNAAGSLGAAKWAHNSWAPAACHKTIDGKEQFFLYFADAGGGIGVLQADSPVGPFKDPLGHGLITRETPNCADVLWLFDPAVLVDADGRAYIYFGGGVPQDKIDHPGTARCVELGDDMISIKGEPQAIDAPYLFEDSGIHKANDKYYYTYCSNWQVDEKGTETYGFVNAEIVCMESDNPLGPFKMKEVILENPGKYFGLYGNNHHCVFNFRDQWYITYHNRVLEQKLGVEKGYRCTFINKFDIQEDGTIGKIKQDKNGMEQLSYLNPYETVNATTFSHQAGLEVVTADQQTYLYGSGTMAVSGIDSGDYFKVTGVDFGHQNAKEMNISMRATGSVDDNCVIELRLDSLKGDVVGYIPAGDLLKDAEESEEFTQYTVELKKELSGVHNLYMIFSGSNYEIRDWSVVSTGRDWYADMIEKSLVSTGSNGRLQKVLAKMENGEKVRVGFIGGSITEGAGADKESESYADQVIANLKKAYPKAELEYVNAGLGGTPSALGIIRYDRDIVDEFGGTPDLLFIEFSVNDYQEVTDGRAFESLIKQAMESNDETAVCLVYAVFKSKWNMQDTYIPLGEAYGLPMISIKDATAQPFADGDLTDEEYFSDEYHPKTYGHTIMADCISYVIGEAAKESVDQIAELPEKEVYGADFIGTKMVTSKDNNGAKLDAGSFGATDEQVHPYLRRGMGVTAFPDNWKHTKDSGNEPLTMTVTCKNLLINVKHSSSEDAGTAVIKVDGEVVKELSSYDQGGWNQSGVEMVLDEKEAKEHTITVEMKAGDEEKEFTILGFGYSK